MRHENFKKIQIIEESVFFEPEVIQEKMTFLGYHLFQVNASILQEYLNLLR